MAKRSLKASSSGLLKAKQAFQRRHWTQDYLAGEVGLQTRQPIWKFFSGRPIERHLFIDICFHLNLDWEEIAEPPQVEDLDLPAPASGVSPTESPSQSLVQQLRQQIAPTIQSQCGVLQAAIDVAQPLPLLQVYTETYLLPHLSNQRWLELDELQGDRPGNRSGLAGLAPSARIRAEQALLNHPRLLIVGKPGSGKTTLLQYLALQTLTGTIYGDRVPTFVALRYLKAELETSESLLEDYLLQQWASYGLSADQGQDLLRNGQVLLLLDGLDELSSTVQDSLHYQIQKFADRHPQVAIILTNRLAAREYMLQGFVTMEIADFDPDQITTFVQKWFATLATDKPDRPQLQADLFLEELQKPENQPIFELAVTPILLHLVCLVFQERGAFPKKRSQLYQTGLDILLIRWDRARGIQRGLEEEGVHLDLSDRTSILSQIAAVFFQRNQYFFAKDEILPLIVNYLVQHQSSQSDPELLWRSSETILRTFTAHYGLLIERARDVYSFSHLTFQEYLTARRIFLSTLSGSNFQEATRLTPELQALCTHVLDPAWRETIALTVELLPNGIEFLQVLVQELNRRVQESAIANLIRWSHQKLNALTETPYHPAAVQAFYLSLELGQSLDLASAIDPSLTMNLHPELSLDQKLITLLRSAKALLVDPSLPQALELCFAFDVQPKTLIPPDDNQMLQSLQETLILATESEEQLQDWCEQEGITWFQQLQHLLRTWRHLSPDWHMTALQWEQLQQYYQANVFFLQCVHRGLRVTAQQRAALLASILQL